MSDIKDILNQLDPEILKALQNADLGDLKDAIEETKEPESLKDEIKIPKTSVTKIVEPRYYHVTIKPDDWKEIEDGWFHSREVYENNNQLRESAILSMYIDEDKMVEENKDVDISIITEYIDKIYDEELLKIKSENLIGNFTYLSKDKPKYIICIELEELPFLDTPASDFGL